MGEDPANCVTHAPLLWGGKVNPNLIIVSNLNTFYRVFLSICLLLCRHLHIAFIFKQSISRAKVMTWLRGFNVWTMHSIKSNEKHPSHCLHVIKYYMESNATLWSVYHCIETGCICTNITWRILGTFFLYKQSHISGMNNYVDRRSLVSFCLLSSLDSSSSSLKRICI